jgi:dTDP-4-dehydrorhamnose 3,5-epimerase
MLQIKRIKSVFEDDRGAIFDLVDKEKISHIGMIISKKGSVRGNHFHKDAKQITYILSGKIELTAKDVSMEGTKPQTIMMEAGDIVTIPSMVAHSLKAIEDTTFLIFTDKQRCDGGYEDDTHRVEI